MRSRITVLVVAVFAVVLVLGVASSAQAFPSKTNPCTGCHGVDTAVKVTAVETSNNGTTATYSVSVSDAYGDGVTGWGVFDGSTKLAGALGAGSFSVAVGKSYTVYGVAGAGGTGANSVVISPTAPPPPADTTPPTVSITAPTDSATVSGSVTINADASDGGSGVASVVFKVDGVTVGTDTSAPYSATWNAAGAAAGAHSIQAVATDGSNNSAAAAISVSIASPPTPPSAQSGTLTVTVTNSTGTPLASVNVVVRDATTGARYFGVTSAAGTAEFASLAYGDYSVSARARGYRASSTSVVVDTPSETATLSLNARTSKHVPKSTAKVHHARQHVTQ
jgi:Bacterial Ig domain/Carboxypeptidase regulatory-like domain